VLAFSGGLPVLYPIGFIFFIVLYWVYKFLLLKYYARTTKFNEEMPLFSIWYIKAGLIIHGLFTMMMVSNLDLLPPVPKNSQDEMSLHLYERAGALERVRTQVLASPHSYTYLVGWIIILVFYVFKNTIWTLACNVLCKKNNAKIISELEEEDLLTSDDFYSEISIRALGDLYLKAKLELKDVTNFHTENVLSKHIKDEKMDDFAPFRFEEEVQITHNEIKESLQQRVTNIEAVIDKHLETMVQF
jgi:hypothetical protein